MKTNTVLKTLNLFGWIGFQLLFFLHIPLTQFAQVPDSLHPGWTTVIAGKQYEKSSFYQWLWGKHYRKDWTTPVKVRTINLDTVNGGLVAYQAGGGRQTNTLRLRNAAGKEYVLRSIDKSFGKALPEIAHGTFVERIANDQVTIAQPYAAITISPMAEAAGIYHTKPVIVFVPSQNALGEFNEKFGNNLYLLEQRPDENWEEASNFGNSKKIVGTVKMLEKIHADNDNSVDDQLFIRSRLFDMFIGDWSRHEDQWRWAEIENGKKTIYRPIPRDRDQAYTMLDGVLLGVALSAVAGHIEDFGNNIKDVALYNFASRNLDRKILNEATREQWLNIAQELQVSLTDNIIDAALNQLPPEIASNFATKIAATLKARRNKLAKWAEEYYEALAETVEITGTRGNEYIRVTNLSKDEMKVEVFALDKQGQPKKEALYSRTFISKETKEIRIFGIDGNDQYELNATQGTPIRMRIIGGLSRDIYKSTGSGKNIIVYDNKDNDLTEFTTGKKKLTENPFVHMYSYTGFEYDKRGLGFSPSYNEDDRIHVRVKYKWEKQQWIKYPFGYQHELAARYSLSERAPSIGYSGIITKAFGNWNLDMLVNYDWITWNNYYGIGNETRNLTNDPDYNRVRSKQFDAGLGISQFFANYHQVAFRLFYQTIKIVDDPERYLAKQVPTFTQFDLKHFGGGRIDYVYQNLNNTIVPTKGVKFAADAQFAQNIKVPDSSVTQFTSTLNIYLPLSKSFTVAVKTGGATLSGKPEFYQLNKLGGGRNLRGFRRYRFYGETMFFNQFELQFLPEVRTSIFNGKAGVIAFYDVGRVWQSGEISSTWHYGYGAGILISPFNKVAVAVFHGWSKNERAIAFRFALRL